MIRTICIFALVTAALAVPRLFEKEHRIVNGTNAPQGKYPSVVSLMYNGVHTCGGTILNEKWLLSAASCIEDENPDTWTVYAGDVDLEGNGERHDVASFIFHDGYLPLEIYHLYYYDIALVEIKTLLTFSDNIQPVSLPIRNQETESGISATVVGWGHSSADGTNMRYLQEAKIVTVSDADCDKVTIAAIHYSDLCAGVPEGGVGQCIGDAGGPLFFNGQQIGIVSWSADPCAQSIPDVYTEVTWFIDWIEFGIEFGKAE